jgi:hypothetical protein
MNDQRQDNGTLAGLMEAAEAFAPGGRAEKLVEEMREAGHQLAEQLLDIARETARAAALAAMDEDCGSFLGGGV